MVTVRLTMLCASAGEGSHVRTFGDGALSAHGRSEITATRTPLPPCTQALRTPSVRCAQTAEALGVEAVPEDGLRDLDCGVWEGRTFKDVAAEDPFGFSAWLTDPDAAPHGGESVRRLCRRTAAWLSDLPADTGHVLVIAEPSVVRAALVHVLSAPARAFWHLDVPPLAAITLTLRDGRWNARLGHLIVPQQRQLPYGSVSIAVLPPRTGRGTVCLTGRP
ncbi:histidine phosphatase family protein [Streptomyces sp. NPDC015171]|uniref:histidine phosphatase family protein n=1 Tax=Streptomyces sp. NPDC015171 TaxID=3364945 RepID=UPI0036FEA535